MIIWFMVCLPLLAVSQRDPRPACLTGHMTELQAWVDPQGVLLPQSDFRSAIDLSENADPVPMLQKKMTLMARSAPQVKYLSMARCRLRAVPTVFKFTDSMGRCLAETVQYMTFYGNEFSDVNSPEQPYDVSLNATYARERAINTPFQRQSQTTWSTGFAETDFPHLKELDLRACSIQVIKDHIFKRMTNLQALYLGENEIYYIDSDAFVGLDNLIHLDFSYNDARDSKGNIQTLTIESYFVFEPLKNMTSLDMSYTKLTQRHVSTLKSIGKKLTRLSLCDTGLINLPDGFFSDTSIRILDLSGNNGIFGRNNTLSGLEDTLQILYAKDTGLRTIDIFAGFEHLEVIDVSMNEISTVNDSTTNTLQSLQILNLDMNRMTTWFGPIFSVMPNLKILSLRDNNINLISEDMIADIADVEFVALSGNFIVCNCHTRDFFDMALGNEQLYDYNMIGPNSNYIGGYPGDPMPKYHRAFIDFNEQIRRRQKVTVNCKEDVCNDVSEESKGKYLLLDYHRGSYVCLQAAESKPINFSRVEDCNRTLKVKDYDKVIKESQNMLYTLLALPCILILIGVAYKLRRNFRYFLITLRNSAMISMINKSEFVDDDTIFHYDVFVSYCNEDRNWVLDHLLPHLESDCSISACLHERDFQVGYSILENIVSCMDRSRSIMLVISQRFLLSQWCQFEMHLAQHRLLETRREDLTLVLLEEIPRRLRPNTLHYLMLTKTYIVWSKDESQQALFWRRMKKALVTMKLRNTSQGVSLA